MYIWWYYHENCMIFFDVLKDISKGSNHQNHIIFALKLNHMTRLEKGCVLINWMAFSLNARWDLCVIWVVPSWATFEYKFPTLIMVITTSLLWLINLFLFWGYKILFTFQKKHNTLPISWGDIRGYKVLSKYIRNCFQVLSFMKYCCSLAASIVTCQIINIFWEFYWQFSFDFEDFDKYKIDIIKYFQSKKIWVFSFVGLFSQTCTILERARVRIKLQILNYST
jgi:hypothetical protein